MKAKLLTILIGLSFIGLSGKLDAQNDTPELVWGKKGYEYTIEELEELKNHKIENKEYRSAQKFIKAIPLKDSLNKAIESNNNDRILTLKNELDELLNSKKTIDFDSKFPHRDSVGRFYYAIKVYKMGELIQEAKEGSGINWSSRQGVLSGIWHVSNFPDSIIVTGLYYKNDITLKFSELTNIGLSGLSVHSGASTNSIFQETTAIGGRIHETTVIGGRGKVYRLSNKKWKAELTKVREK